MGKRLSHLMVVGALLLLAGSAHAQGSGNSSFVHATKNLNPRPSGGDITIIASVDDSAQKVDMTYVIGYGSETTVGMSSSGGNYMATIPSSDVTPGSMVRWYVVATDGSGNTHREPPFSSPDEPQYYGTVVEDTGDNSTLPIIDLYCKDDKAPYNNDRNVGPGCSVWFAGEFFDNVIVHRRGATSLSWPKPKFRIDAAKHGKAFNIKDGSYRVKELDLNSEWAEPGENTFMRETVGWQILKQMGVDSLISYQTHVRMNGQYYGKFALQEIWKEDSLKANGYSVDPTPGPLFKSTSGEYSNLRWDIPPDQVLFYYDDVTLNNDTTAISNLVDLGKGLAGGGSLPRSKYIFEWINLPKTINQMAAQTVLLNQDRCTKNFYVYLDPSSKQWAMLPWDVESVLGIDRGLGGQPAPDYCILACEQWNSPLYCDKNHPQDLAVSTPWGLITTNINPTSAAAGRKLRDAASSGGGGSGSGATEGTADNGAAKPGLTLPSNSSIASDYDADQTKKGPTPNGAPGTFNYLIDAITALPRTRAMYMRRVRTLMDQFMSSGQLQSIITNEYQRIKDEAARDAQKWGNPGSADRGYQQLITEQLPIRKDQLYNKYGPGGDTPLIPDAQPRDVSLSIGAVSTGSDGFVEVVNDNDIAVDVSGWKLSGGGVTFTFVPGTVIPPKDSVYVAASSIGTFKGRGSAPSGGQGLFVVGPMEGTPSGPAGISISSS